LEGLKIRSSRAIFKSQKWSEANQPAPSTHIFCSLGASNRSFQIFILLKIVQRTYTNALSVDTTPKSPGTRVVIYAPGAYKVS
jgi:hypothetical protein